MSTFNRVVAADENASLAPTVRARLATEMADPASEVGASLSGTFSQLRTGRPSGNGWVAMGDSITSYNNSFSGAAGGWFHRLCTSSLGRIHSVGVGAGGIYATGGYTLEQMEDTHLPTILALNPLPGACVVFGGTNNTGASSGTGFDFTAATATLGRICSSLASVGIAPVLVLIPPRGDSALVRQNVDLWNTYIYELSQSAGYPLLDAFTPVVNPSTGGYLAALAIDGVHPNEAGHAAIADYNIAQGLSLTTMPNRPLPALFNAYYNLVTSGQGLFITDSAGLGTGWSLAGGGTGVTTTVSSPVTADNLKGRWQHLSQATAGGGNAWIQKQVPSGWGVGDVLEFSIRLRATGFSTLNTAYDTGAESGSVAYSLGILTVGAGSTPRGIQQWIIDVADGTFSGRVAVPAGTTSIYIRLVTNPGSTASIAGDTDIAIGEVTLRNLTTMGLSAI